MRQDGGCGAGKRLSQPKLSERRASPHSLKTEGSSKWRSELPLDLNQDDPILRFDIRAKTRATDNPKAAKPTHRYGEAGPIPSTSEFKYRIAKRTAYAMRNFNADAVRIDFIAG